MHCGLKEENVTIFYDTALESIEDAIDAIDEITDNEKFNELRIVLFSKVVSAVHQISDYYERIKEHPLPLEIDNEFRAYAYLNNQIKHDKDLEFIYFEVAESVHPMFYPFQFDSPGLYWKNFRDNGRANARGKREHYEAHLMDRDVKATLSKMKETIVSTTHIVEEMKS